MDSKKILVIVAVVIIIGAAAGIVLMTMNKDDGADLKVSYLKKNGYETFMVAENKGYFGDAGIKVEGVPVTGSGQDAVNLLLSGDVDIAATGQGPVASTLNSYLDDTVIVCGVNYSTGGQVWVSAKDTGLVAYNKDSVNKAAVKTSFSDFVTNNGRAVKLGVQQGATTESEVKSWLKAMEVSFANFGDPAAGKMVELVNLKANQLVSAMSTGDIDVLAASQPYPSKALSDIPDSYKLGSNADTNSYDVACYITTKKVYDEKKDLIEKFIKGLDTASKYMADPANQEECVNICTDVIGTSKETVQAAFDIAQWKVDWSDGMANMLFKTCTKKGFTAVTAEDCSNKCLFKEYIATL